MDNRTDFFGDVLRIALGIIIAGVVLWILAEARMNYLANRAMQDIEQALGEIEIPRPRPTRQVPPRTNQPKPLTSAEQAAIRLEAQEAAKAKEAAWRAYFQPSAECQRESTVACGNAYMKARAQFESEYQLSRP